MNELRAEIANYARQLRLGLDLDPWAWGTCEAEDWRAADVIMDAFRTKIADCGTPDEEYQRALAHRERE